MRGFKRLRLGVPVIAVLFGLLIGIQPVLADTELGHTGTVGAHSLLDTTALPGGQCAYQHLAAYDVNKLKSMVARSPRVKAVAGKSSQLVGYRVIVQRRSGSIYSNNVWTDKFTSAEHTAMTSDTANAYFGANPSITVTVPFGPDQQDVYAEYRIVMKLIWHNSDGSIQGTAMHRVGHYNSFKTGSQSPPQTAQPGKCPDYWYE
ncbi:MAG: hypothetical protein QOJ81_910 [Chloroflexota bacterium]|nr:hypothetical protein [Chloroflexota bacterium]